MVDLITGETGQIFDRYLLLKQASQYLDDAGLDILQANAYEVMDGVARHDVEFANLGLFEIRDALNAYPFNGNPEDSAQFNALMDEANQWDL